MIQTKFDDLRRRKSYEEKRNLPLRTIAQEAGLALGTVQRLSKGEADRVYISTVDTLCRYFTCGVGELLEYVPDAAADRAAGKDGA